MPLYMIEHGCVSDKRGNHKAGDLNDGGNLYRKIASIIKQPCELFVLVCIEQVLFRLRCALSNTHLDDEKL